MKTVKRLLRTPRPHPDEGLKGLIIRATEENGYDMSTALSSFADVIEDFKTKRTIYTEQKWRNLSKMLNLEIPILQDMACLSGIEERPPQFYNMFGHKIHKYSIRVRAPKVCPGCLRDSSYIRKIWDLAAFTCCPHHGTMLIEKCPSCGEPIWWSRGKVSMCPCGQDWREIDLPQVSEKELILPRLILNSCGLLGSGGPRGGGTPCEDTGNPLSSVRLSELLCAVYFIAGRQHSVVDATGKHYAVKLAHKELHEALTNAIAVFEKWPENYFKFLEESRGIHYNGERQAGLYKDFGKFYDPLFIRKGNPFPDFMREAFKQYITTQWDGGYAGWCSSLSSDDLKGKTYMTKWEAMKYLGVSIQTVNLLHKKGYLKGPYYPWVNRTRVMIESESVKVLKKRWDTSINAQQAGEVLGVGRIAVVSLMKSDCLSAIQGPTVTGQLEWKFEVAEVGRLLEIVLAKIPDGKAASTSLVGFHKAIQKLSKLSLDVGAFIKLVLDGKIIPAERGARTGLSGLLFDSDDLRRFSQDEAVKKRGDRLTLREVAKLLTTKHEEVVLLTKRKLLFAEEAAEGRGGTWAITQSEFDRFTSEYMNVGQIAEIFCTSSKGISKRLIGSGVEPVSGPTVDGGLIYFFRRGDIEALDLAAILPKAKISNIQKMNEKGLVNTRQLSDIAHVTADQIRQVVDKGHIVPAVTLHPKGGKGPRWFFSPDQIEKFKKLKAVAERQIALFDGGAKVKAAA